MCIVQLHEDTKEFLFGNVTLQGSLLQSLNNIQNKNVVSKPFARQEQAF